MVKKLGPILLIGLLGGTALAQEPASITARLGAASLTPSQDIAWGTDSAAPVEPHPPAPPQPAQEPPGGPMELLLALTDAF